uniref:Uncharacterized protein n=1 Tax=viral metagenome TaxID=1070528 RepID=A0A6C0LEB4_9ZZZZ
MKKTTTITYNIETRDGVAMRELEYKDYVKNEKGEENLLHYKVRNSVNVGVEDGDSAMKVIADSDKDIITTTNESFNKIYKTENTIDETVGISSNNNDWKIHEYKNHQLDKQYKQSYDTINFDVKGALLEHCYIKDK